MKCFKCDDELATVSLPNSGRRVELGGVVNPMDATLWACISRDCKNMGVIVVLPDPGVDLDEEE